MSELVMKHFVPCEGGTPPMAREDAQRYLQMIAGWTPVDDHIEKEFRFKTYLDGLEFANALGRIAEHEDHHPDMLVRWRRVKVMLITHNIKGLSENDFIIAAKADELYKQYANP